MATMTANISELGNLQAIDIDLDTYSEAPTTSKGSFRLPEAGEYLLRAPNGFPDEAFTVDTDSQGRTRLTARVDPVIVGSQHADYELRYIDVNTTPFTNDPSVSWIKTYLQACGVSGKLSTVAEIMDAIRATSGKVYSAVLDWEAKKGRDFKVSGMKNFPTNSDGSFQGWVDHPTELDAEGRKLRVWARLRVRRYLRASS